MIREHLSLLMIFLVLFLNILPLHAAEISDGSAEYKDRRTGKRRELSADHMRPIPRFVCVRNMNGNESPE